MNRIVQVDNFQNMACCCENWLEFTRELEEWGVYGCAKIDFDDEELEVNNRNYTNSIHFENQINESRYYK